VTETATFRVASGLQPEWWNPLDGRVGAARIAASSSSADGSIAIDLNLPPYGTQFLVFTPHPASRPAQPAANATSATAASPLDLSRDWDVTFKNAAPEPDPAPRHFSTLASWTDAPE